MSTESRIYNAIENVKMSDEEKARMRTKLVQSCNEAGSSSAIIENRSGKWRLNYAMAALVIIGVLALPVSVYAVKHFSPFAVFFENAGEQRSVLEELLQYASSEAVSAETNDYKVTILNHLYSSEQKMGMLICSVKMKRENDYFLVDSKESGQTAASQKYLGRDEVISGDKALTDKSRQVAFTMVENDDAANVKGTTMYYDGQQAEDGGYLLGVRYDDVSQLDNMKLRLGEEGMEGEVLAELALPAVKEMPTKIYVNPEKKDTKYVVSAIGISILGIGDGAQRVAYDDETEGMSVRKNTILQMGDKEVTVAQLATDVMNIEDKGEYYNYYQPFNSVINLEQVNGIRMN